MFQLSKHWNRQDPLTSVDSLIGAVYDIWICKLAFNGDLLIPRQDFFTLILWAVLFFKFRGPEASVSSLAFVGILLRPSLPAWTPVNHMDLRMFSDSSSDHIFSLSFLDVSHPVDLLLTDKEASYAGVTDLLLSTYGQIGVSQGLALPWVFSL